MRISSWLWQYQMIQLRFKHLQTMELRISLSKLLEAKRKSMEYIQQMKYLALRFSAAKHLLTKAVTQIRAQFSGKLFILIYPIRSCGHSSFQGKFLKLCFGCYANSIKSIESGNDAAFQRKIVVIGGRVVFQGSNGSYLSRCRNYSSNGINPDLAFTYLSYKNDPISQWVQVKKNGAQAVTGNYLQKCKICAPAANLVFLQSTSLSKCAFTMSDDLVQSLSSIFSSYLPITMSIYGKIVIQILHHGLQYILITTTTLMTARRWLIDPRPPFNETVVIAKCNYCLNEAKNGLILLQVYNNYQGQAKQSKDISTGGNFKRLHDVCFFCFNYWAISFRRADETFWGKKRNLRQKQTRA